MRIEKKGLIYCPKGDNGWDVNSFMTPHAIRLDGRIRIYGGCRDEEGVSRIGFIDVNENNPSEIIRIGKSPVLDVGNPGCFDDNGVILGDIIQIDKKLYMYYVGFQHVQKVKFYAFSGIAISEDQGESFHRYSQVPALDRTSTGRYGRCVHTIMYDEGIYKCWYAVINGWKYINNVPYPIYNIWYTESENGIDFDRNDKTLCIDVIGDEYRIGRPKVYKTSDGYEMYYTRDLVTKEYLAGYATSVDGIHWKRQDDKFVLPRSIEGWDSEMACYPVKLTVNDKIFCFYNGNGMGNSGVGYAELFTN